jgi:hypothetical protein
MDVGVHLTLTTAGENGMAYRPLLSRAEVPGLYNPDGYLWQSSNDAWKHATADEIKRESRAQIEQAIHMGIDPTHLDPHDGIRGANLPEFDKLYGELGKEFSLPVRMPPTQARLIELGQPGLRAMISKMGVLMPDQGLQSQGQMSFFRQTFRGMAPGTVTEIYIHPAIDGPEIQAVRMQGGWWKIGLGDLQLFTSGRDELRQAIKEEGIILIGWREIRDLQRRGA